MTRTTADARGQQTPGVAANDLVEQRVTFDRSRLAPAGPIDVGRAERRLQKARRDFVVECCRSARAELNDIEGADSLVIVDRLLIAIGDLRRAETELMGGALR